MFLNNTFEAFFFFFIFNIFSTLCFNFIIELFFPKTTFLILVNVLFIIIFLSLLLILFGLDFIGVVYIIVYAGAILILFLSVLMLVNLRLEDLVETIELQEVDMFNFWFNIHLKYFFLSFYFFLNFFIYFTDLFDFKYFLEDMFYNDSFDIFILKGIVYYLSQNLYFFDYILLIFIGLMFFLVMIVSISTLVFQDISSEIK